MKTINKKIWAVVLACTMFVHAACSPGSFLRAHAQSESTQDGEHGMGYIDSGIEVDAPFSYYSDSLLYSAQIPSSYDLRELNRVTAVKDQGSHGTCWAFTAMACIESSLITKGYADTSIDLSEEHLAYYTYTYSPDKLGNTAGDQAVGDGTYLQNGGNSWLAGVSLANWKGVVIEEKMPYNGSSSFTGGTYASENAYSLNKYLVDNVYWIATDSTDYIKQKIMELGACEAAIFYSTSYINAETSAYCSPATISTNHAVVVVGWDDNYSKDNFKAECKPQNDGAWLVRNSWGTDWAYGDDGYFWLSYEDGSFYYGNNEMTFYEASPLTTEHNIYQYDGGYYHGRMSGSGMMKAASIYTAQDDEWLSEVAFYTEASNISYSVEIYTGVTSLPDDGTAALSQPLTGTAGAVGYYTVSLDKPVRLEKGEKFSIVLLLTDSDDTSAYYSYDKSSRTSTPECVSSAQAGQCFYGYGSGSWSDLTEWSSTAAFRIKGVTVVRIPGDVNDDGEVTLTDSTVLRRYLAHWENITINSSNADVNGDGKVNLMDSAILRRYLAGWDDVSLV